MRFEQPEAIERRELERRLVGPDFELIADALISAAFYEADWRWVQDQSLAFLNHSRSEVRAAAIIVFGHLARIHHELDLDRVLPALEHARLDSQIAGTVEDALDDIRLFIPTH